MKSHPRSCATQRQPGLPTFISLKNGDMLVLGFNWLNSFEPQCLPCAHWVESTSWELETGLFEVIPMERAGDQWQLL